MYVITQADLRDVLDACAQSVELLPPSVEMYRIGYLRALRQVATVCGIYRPEPLPRRQLPDIIGTRHLHRGEE